jgi:hypothetical protein
MKKLYSSCFGKSQTRKSDKWGQLSRDIEGDLITDLINENNPFHEFSDSYKAINNHFFKNNVNQVKWI